MLVSTWKHRPIKFSVVGAWNTGFSFLLFTFAYMLLKNQYSINHIMTGTWALSVLQSYFTQRIFVWKSDATIKIELPKFFTISVLQLMLNISLMTFFVRNFDLPIIQLQFGITLFLVTLSYYFMKEWTFKVK